MTNTYVPGSGDFNGNGADDIVWFSPSSASGDHGVAGHELVPASYSLSSVHSG